MNDELRQRRMAAANASKGTSSDVILDAVNGMVKRHQFQGSLLDFQRICPESKFAPLLFCFTNRGGLPKLPDLSWQAISLGLLQGRLFSDNVLLVARKPGSE